MYLYIYVLIKKKIDICYLNLINFVDGIYEKVK